MRLLTLPLLVSSAFLSSTIVNAYVVNVWQTNDCSGPVNATYDLKSDGECQTYPWFEGGYSFMYDSDVGCELSLWDHESCVYEREKTRTQNVCFVPGFKVKGLRCGEYNILA